LRVGFVVEYSPFIIKRLISGSTSEFMSGILVDIWKDYARIMKYNLNFVEFESYGTELGERRYNGLLGEIANKTIHGSTEKFKITSNRIRDFMYTAPVVYASDAYIVRQRSIEKFTPSSYLVFDPLNIFLFILIVLIAAYIEQLIHNLRQRIIFPQFIYGSAFTGTTVAGGVDVVTLKSVQEQCRRGSRKLLLEQDLYFNQEKESELFGRIISLPSSDIHVNGADSEDAEMLCSSDEFAMKTDTFGARKMQLHVAKNKSEHSQKCKLTSVSPGPESDFPHKSIISSSVRTLNPYAFFFNYDTPTRFIDKFNEVILKLYPFDMITCFYWRKYTNRNMNPPVEPKFAFTYDPIKFKDVQTIFIILAVGLFVSICAGIIEKFSVTPIAQRKIEK
ncbi:hypothetical protein PFISCL1PPCAC_6024, partial [Pristionchus fissidentatus]